MERSGRGGVEMDVGRSRCLLSQNEVERGAIGCWAGPRRVVIVGEPGWLPRCLAAGGPVHL